MIPISAIVTSASTHDSQAALSLAEMSAQRVTSLYDLMDSAYSSEFIRQHGFAFGHVPLIKHNLVHTVSIPASHHTKLRGSENAARSSASMLGLRMTSACVASTCAALPKSLRI